MAKLYKKLASPAYLTTSPVNYYTVGSSKLGVLRYIHLANVGNTVVTVTVWITDPTTSTVPIMAERKIPAYSFLAVPMDLTLDATSVLRAQASAASAITMAVGGFEIIDT